MTLTQYLGNFIIFTMAMIGIITICFIVYKKLYLNAGINQNTSAINIESALRLSPKKVLYIISADKERFLIASDMDRTTLISKLEKKEINIIKEEVLEESLTKINDELPAMKRIKSKVITEEEQKE